MSERHFNLKMNEEELEIHNRLKKMLHYEGRHGEDSQTFKIAEVVALNVLHNLFGAKLEDVFKYEAIEKLEDKRANQQLKAQLSNTRKAFNELLSNTEAGKKPLPPD